MSETSDDVMKKRWINFGDGRSGEQVMVDNSSDRNNKQEEKAIIDDQSNQIHLPPPPRNSDKLNEKDKYSNKSSRSSTPYSLNSPSSSSSRLNNQDNSTNRSTGRLTDKLKDKSTVRLSRLNDKSLERSNDCALSIPETFMRSSSSNLQNIPLKEEIMPITDTSTSNSSQTNSRFKNGDILVSLLPLNRHCAWLSPAIFKSELVPEELMSPEFRLTVEDYVQAMSTLINDYRFNLYIVFYKKVTLIWLTLGFCILFSLLFSNAEGVILFFGILIWVLINTFGFLLTFWMKTKMMRNLERCLARVNEQFYKYNIILCVDDKGKLSCHKITLIFLYFDSTECIKYLNGLLNRDGELESINNTISNLNQLNNNNNSNAIDLNKYSTSTIQSPIDMMQQDVEINDIIITGSAPTRFTQKEKYGEKLFLRYSQRWALDLTSLRIGFNQPLHYDASVSPSLSIQPRHCEKARCVCQYIEEHLSFKPYHRFSLRDLIG